MKKSLLFLLLLTTVHIAFAQRIAITGIVKNIEGQPIRAVIAVLNGAKSKTDSTGIFKVMATLPATLDITAVGYKDTSININDKVNISIILKFSVNITATRDSKAPMQDPGTAPTMSNMVTQMRQTNTEINPSLNEPVKVTLSMGGQGSRTFVVQRNVDFDAAQGAIFPQFNPKEETQGSRYIFKDWVPGSVINMKGELLANPNYVYNYDKMGGELLATKDGHSAIEVNRDIVKYFRLAGGNGDTVSFANMPLLDKVHYVQVLAEGNKFGIYKVIKTRFEKADYTTDGIMSQGNNFDSYIDEYTYYMIDVQTGKAQQIFLKKKSIKSLFTADVTKVNKFVEEHSSDSIDENYLRNLGDYMNE